jgi:hypothetical protein
VTKTALCIGINDYPGTGNDLAGCVNDADDWAEALTDRFFTVDQLLDAAATGDAIREAIRRKLAGAQYGDTVVITFSGHGTWVPDEGEGICPHDVLTQGPLLDDELFDLFDERERGVRTLLISDSCRSGPVARFAPPLHPDAARVRFLPPSAFLPLEVAAGAARLPRAGATRPRYATLLLSACRDVEYCYDTHFGNRANGAFSYVALATLQKLKPEATYQEWQAAMAAQLPSQDCPQTPTLDGSGAQRHRQVLS